VAWNFTLREQAASFPSRVGRFPRVIHGRCGPGVNGWGRSGMKVSVVLPILIAAILTAARPALVARGFRITRPLVRGTLRWAG
jgi:hypothetical protein